VLYFIVKNFDWIIATGYDIISSLLAALSPLFIGLIIAYLLNPLVSIIDRQLVSRLLERRIPDDPIKAEKRRNLSRFFSVLITFILVLAAITAIIYGFAVMILGQFVFTDFSSMLDGLVKTFTDYEAQIQHWMSSNLPSGMVSDKFLDLANLILGWISNNFSASSAMATITGAVGSAVNVVIGAVISIYLMKDKDFFLSLWRKFLHLTLSQRANATVSETISEINGVTSMFVRGALLDSLIVAILSSIGLSIVGLDFAVFIGVFAGIANIIPYFGPIIGMVPAFIIGLLTENFTHGIMAVVVLVVVQQIDSNIVYPKVVGSTTGLHPLMVLLAVSIFGYFGGIIGMILAVPLAGILQVFIVKWALKRERKEKGIKKEEAEDTSRASTP
jgi:predicted PurR-regulated permease PerM